MKLFSYVINPAGAVLVICSFSRKIIATVVLLKELNNYVSIQSMNPTNPLLDAGIVFEVSKENKGENILIITIKVADSENKSRGNGIENIFPSFQK
jgi:hypothetical protein